MSLVAFSFGAFGDVLALADLVSRVVKSLSGSCGASHAYQALILELNTLNDALRHVERLADARGSRYRSPDAPFSRANIQGFVSACAISVRKIECQILKYQQMLKKGSSGNRWIESWRKIGWGLFREDEINKYREEVRDYMTMIHGILSASNHSMLSRLQDATKDQKPRSYHADSESKLSPNAAVGPRGSNDGPSKRDEDRSTNVDVHSYIDVVHPNITITPTFEKIRTGSSSDAIVGDMTAAPRDVVASVHPHINITARARFDHDDNGRRASVHVTPHISTSIPAAANTPTPNDWTSTTSYFTSSPRISVASEDGGANTPRTPSLTSSSETSLATESSDGPWTPVDTASLCDKPTSKHAVQGLETGPGFSSRAS